MKSILMVYEVASRQAINLQKSEIYCCRNVPDPMKQNNMAILGVRAVLRTGKYLALPYMIGGDQNSTFAYVKDTVWHNINSWSVSVYPKRVVRLRSNWCCRPFPPMS